MTPSSDLRSSARRSRYSAIGIDCAPTGVSVTRPRTIHHAARITNNSVPSRIVDLMRHPLLFALSTSLGLILAACNRTPAPVPQDSEKLTQDFIYGTLALSPTNATAAGYHQH